MNIVPHMPRSSRYAVGLRIENKFLDLLELAYTAYFIQKDQKPQKLSECILNLDILKFLFTLAWEAKFVTNKQYEELATKLDEIGKMFWGWKKKNPT